MDTITKVELKLFKENNPTNTIIVSIKSSLTGKDLTVISKDASDITSSPKWIEFDFPDIYINPGETYYIVCRTPGGSQTNYYCCMFYTNNPYAYGTVWGSLNYGISWEIIEYPGYPDPDGCFKTYGLDETPDKPSIDGPTNGKINIDQTFKISTTDPENDSIYYYVDWGDGTNSGWAGPYNSGFEISMIHFWSEINTYIIKVKAKDKYGAESPWTTFSISIPKFRIAEKKADTTIWVFGLMKPLTTNLNKTKVFVILALYKSQGSSLEFLKPFHYYYFLDCVDFTKKLWAFCWCSNITES